MKVVILAGGLGTRISEESHLRPKPMITIGDMPILWHIMKIYSSYGLRDFIICMGYKSYIIKEYFNNYMLHSSSTITFDVSKGSVQLEGGNLEDWRITLVDTGLNTQTGGRLKRVAHLLDDDKDFCLTYGDGLSDIDINAQVKFHLNHGGMATVSAVSPPGRFGVMGLGENDLVNSFSEKVSSTESFVNGGFFILSKDVMQFIEGDDTIWEQEPLKKLSRLGQLHAYKHSGFWQPMDTLRERILLENIWNEGSAPWKRW